MCISVSCICILYFYVTNLALWLQDFNKLTYLLIASFKMYLSGEGKTG